jgi:hypothetical protein
MLAIIVIPTLVYFAGLSSSLAAGTSLVGLLLVTMEVQPFVTRDSHAIPARRFRGFTIGMWALLIVALIAVHTSVAWLYLPFDIGRAAGSLLPLAVVLVGGCLFGDRLLRANDRQVDRAVRVAYLLMFVFALFGILRLQPHTATTSERPIFPFTEPSHFALVFIPLLIYCSMRSHGIVRYAIWLMGLVIAGLMQSLILGVGCMVAALVIVRGLAIIPLLAAMLGVLAFADLSYYAQRLDLFSDTQNASALVFLQGWQLIGESMTDSHGWGLGFQQLGVHGTHVPAADIIYTAGGVAQNLLDGGFVLAKLVSEFGVFGLLLVIFYIRIAWRSVRIFRSSTLADLPANEVLARSVIIGYSVELFTRGAGYFTSTAILLTASVWFLLAQSRQPMPEPMSLQTVES